jgi:alkane 1-monooxygenase
VGWALSGAPVLDIVLLAVGTGVLTVGGGINIAHELMHRSRPLDQALAEVLMTSVSYPWFCVEHVLGHHRNVATPADPATARPGESVYAFLPRTLVGGLRSAWALERDRVRRRKLAPFGPRDRRTRYGAWLVLMYGTLAALGWQAVLFFAVQSLVAVLLLEVTNYLEHYGLQRAPLPGGRFERVQPHHSWNSAHRLTGRFLFNLPRHADHHAWASRPYWQLRHWPDAPQLPAGYTTMLIVALVPPLWRAIMDPRVERVRQRPAPAK